MVILYKESNRKFITFLVVLSIIIKVAAAPIHQWFLNILLKLNWINRYLLITWQKLAPLYLTLYQIKKLVFWFVVTSSIIGRFLQMNKKKISEIIGLSSIFNLGWMLLATIISLRILLIFRVIYWMGVGLTLLLFSLGGQKTINNENSRIQNNIIYIIIIANIAGLPPLAGFFSKWLVFKERLILDTKPLISLILIIRAINFYIYLRIFLPPILATKNKSIKRKIKKVIFYQSSLLLIFLPLFLGRM